MTTNWNLNRVIKTILTIFSPGTLALDQSQLARLTDTNEDIRTSMEPLNQVPSQKSFVPKYPIPVLKDYRKEVYPLHYWGTWEKFPLGDGKAEPWINTKEFRKQLTKAGIDPNSDANRTILTNLVPQTSEGQEDLNFQQRVKIRN